MATPYPSAPPPCGEAGVPPQYPPSNNEVLFPIDSRPTFGATTPQPVQSFPPQQARQISQPQQQFNYQQPQPQPGYPAAPAAYPNAYPPTQRGSSGYAPPAPQPYGTFPPAPQGYRGPTGYPQPGPYGQTQGYPTPGLYSSSSGNTDMAMAAGMGALAGLAGSYLADSTPTMGEMAVGAGVGGAMGLAGSALTSNSAMGALGLAGHDMGALRNQRRARQMARYGIPIAAMGAGYLTNKAFDRGYDGYDSE